MRCCHDALQVTCATASSAQGISSVLVPKTYTELQFQLHKTFSACGALVQAFVYICLCNTAVPWPITHAHLTELP